MMRFAAVLLLATCSSVLAYSQDAVINPAHGTSFATVGRPPVPTPLGGRCIDRLNDKLDRYPCCGYGKTHNDMGVPGFRSSISFYWSGACEYFREDCRRPTASTEPRSSRPNGAQRMWNEMFGNGDCATCGK